ncbi:MAG: methyltransferase domain-containing protein [Deltaproteobacteria bacterium]|nr:methyltransferase domain-containing protein [Deltaproteobacteria bacterium]
MPPRTRLRDVLLGRDHVCPWWFVWTFDNPLRRMIHDPEQILGGLVRPGDTAVDVGCGRGYFTVPLAGLVGPGGRVVAVDLQDEMLAGVRRRAERAGVAGRVRLHRCGPDRLGVEGPADLVLAFWMAHEVPERARFLGEVAALLRPGGHLLLAEPVLHVAAREVERTIALAEAAGLVRVTSPRIAFSRSALLRRPA